MDIEELVKLTSRAWSLDILTQMHSGTPARQAPLLEAVGAGRTAFAQSLKHLIEIGMVERNPGHGHPLRPEFRLTPMGKEAALTAVKIKRAIRLPEEHLLLRRAWSIPILAANYQPQHFIGIKKQLPTITDRALSQSIKQLEARKWLNRKIDEQTRPPRAIYQACNAGAKISKAVGLTYVGF